MGLDVWFRDDIQRALRAAMTATISAYPSDDYLRGYWAALASIAAAFGISQIEISPEGTRNLLKPTP